MTLVFATFPDWEQGSWIGGGRKHCIPRYVVASQVIASYAFSCVLVVGHIWSDARNQRRLLLRREHNGAPHRRRISSVRGDMERLVDAWRRWLHHFQLR